MKKMYQESDWGWNEANKKMELFEDAARYLIAYSGPEAKPVAYCHFRSVAIPAELGIWALAVFILQLMNIKTNTFGLVVFRNKLLLRPGILRYSIHIDSCNNSQFM